MSALAVLEDRHQLALTLHDSVGALLFSLGAAVVKDLRTDAPPHLLDKLSFIEDQASAAMAMLVIYQER